MDLEREAREHLAACRRGKLYDVKAALRFGFHTSKNWISRIYNELPNADRQATVLVDGAPCAEPMHLMRIIANIRMNVTGMSEAVHEKFAALTRVLVEMAALEGEEGVKEEDGSLASPASPQETVVAAEEEEDAVLAPVDRRFRTVVRRLEWKRKITNLELEIRETAARVVRARVEGIEQLEAVAREQGDEPLLAEMYVEKIKTLRLGFCSLLDD